MRYLITGGCGFLGSNIAAHLIERQEEVVILDSLYRFGANLNLEWLKTLGKFTFIHADVRNQNDVERAILQHRPEVIFHLAGQVAMTTSIDNPRMDFEVNVLGSLNVLEAVRKFSPETVVVYSSTNKVYGDLENVEHQETETRYIAPAFPEGFSEQATLDFHSPYGCSKGAADQYMLDYARIYGLKTVVFRHSSIYGERQFSTFDQGWVGWFCMKALEFKQDPGSEAFTISGTGKQVRDVLHAQDAIQAYLTAVSSIDQVQGQAFNLGGTMSNSLSLLELFQLLESLTGATLKYTRLDWRASDQKIFVADTRKFQGLTGWRPEVSSAEGVQRALNWLENR